MSSEELCILASWFLSPIKQDIGLRRVKSKMISSRPVTAKPLVQLAVTKKFHSVCAGNCSFQKIGHRNQSIINQ